MLLNPCHMNDETQNRSQLDTSHSPIGVTLIALFFVFGATMSGLTAIMLAFPHSPLEPLWRLNPRARDGFHSIGFWAVLLMVAVCSACTLAALGLKRLNRWGLWIAVTVLTVNLIGDTANAVFAHDYRALIGLPIGSFLIAYLIKKRSAFQP